MRLRSIWLVSFLVMVSATARAAQQGFTTLDVNGDGVTIYRDEFGVPHIFAETNYGLFVGYGYAVAQDRLWQLELFRRAAYGRLAEILGPQYPVTNLGGGGAPLALSMDMTRRTNFYTPQELDEQFAMLTDEEKEIFSAYADGINRYVSEVVVSDPPNKLPFEFQYLLSNGIDVGHSGTGVPDVWTYRDVVANVVYQARFGEVGGTERRNQNLLSALIASHGNIDGYAIFNDVFWLDDPDSPVTVPSKGAVGKRQQAQLPPPLNPDQLVGASASSDSAADEALDVAEIPRGIGSHGWVVSAAKSATGSAMLFGGPQVDFNTPEIFHEVQLNGGNGFNVVGLAIAGVPGVAGGRTNHVAFSPMTGSFGDNTDVYVESLCGGGTGYTFNEICTTFETRTETINVKGAAPLSLTVRRAIHGPVVGTGTGVVFSQKRTDWMREVFFAKAILAADRASSLQDFELAIQQLPISLNFVYADKVGNIAYFGPADTPVRPSVDTRTGNPLDPRLPLPGTGGAEWTGSFLPMPLSINPAQGWLAGWNNKPAAGWHNPDNRAFGKQFRVLDIFQHFTGPNAPSQLSQQDMEDIEQDISRSQRNGDGRESRYILPYLLAALNAAPPTNLLGQQAITALNNWDGGYFDDPVTSATFAPGQVIFSTWLSIMLGNTFQGWLISTNNFKTASTIEGGSGGLTNMLLHVLDHACEEYFVSLLVGGCPNDSVPPSRDYFNGDPKIVMSAAFDQALTQLGTDPSKWANVLREPVHLRHTLYPTIPEVPCVQLCSALASSGASDIGTFLNANRSTYGQIISLSTPAITSTNILTLGQSGFIGPGSSDFDSHFMDQLPIFKTFGYKPMHLFINTQLKE